METLPLANQHQIANSLQIIASILLLKARSVQSQETRTHLENVHCDPVGSDGAATTPRQEG